MNTFSEITLYIICVVSIMQPINYHVNLCEFVADQFLAQQGCFRAANIAGLTVRTTTLTTRTACESECSNAGFRYSGVTYVSQQ